VWDCSVNNPEVLHTRWFRSWSGPCTNFTLRCPAVFRTLCRRLSSSTNRRHRWSRTTGRRRGQPNDGAERRGEHHTSDGLRLQAAHSAAARALALNRRDSERRPDTACWDTAITAGQVLALRRPVSSAQRPSRHVTITDHQDSVRYNK